MLDLTEGIVKATDQKTCKNNYCRRNSKRNRLETSHVHKNRCNKVLKRKLKQYKIRRNGEEDPDGLNISRTLISSLIIKSPSTENTPPKKSLSEFTKFNNYLFNMGKRRKCNILSDSNKETDDFKLEAEILSVTESSEEKLQTNAFQLMMESRYKSIGINSPGKERATSESDSQEIIEKRELKAKRMLSLQKMSEAKGSLKNKEIEEYRDRCIKKQMLKRTEHFKIMITNPDSESKTKERTHLKNPPSPSKVEILHDGDGCLIDIKKTLQLCNMFEKSDAEVHNKKHQSKKLSNEDREFLNKLSPSIRKKEDMMSYFQKVSKSPEDVLESDDNISQDIIKVKFKPKHKRKKCTIKANKDGKPNYEYDLKQKQEKVKDQTVGSTEANSNSLTEVNKETRPKRKTKRPAKYLDDIDQYSSDEELHIFTPKKKRNSIKKMSVNDEFPKSIINDKLNNGKILNGTSKAIEDTKKEKTERNDSIKQKNSKSQVKTQKNMDKIKLAPIFVSKQSHLSIAEKEARQKFLQSGIPEKLKRLNSQKPKNISIVENFHSVVHIQQSIAMVSNKNVIDFYNENRDNEHLICNFNDIFRTLINLNKENKQTICMNFQCNNEELLHNLKKSYQKFPVYRTYHLLKGKSRGEYRDYNYPDLDNSVEIINGLLNNEYDSIDKQCWVDKYKPTSSKQVIGNFTAIDELKKWLQSWTENLAKTKDGINSDGSDFDVFQDSDTDYGEVLKNFNNVLIICGDVGSGKTSAVYAVASELAIKVIEVNASSKRTGKIMLQDLQEATRSHKVDRGKSISQGSQKTQEVLKIKLKSRGRTKKQKEKSNVPKCESIETGSSQEGTRTHSSLILIDDADIVFEQDDGFCSAVSQLTQSSKRPVILVTSSLSSPHLQRFIQDGKIINMHKFLPHMLGIWLDIMCIADIGMCCPGLGNSLLNYYKGDIRKTIHCLQFYMASFKHTSKEDPSQDFTDKISIEDENSSLSWTDHESNQISNVYSSSDAYNNIVQQFIKTICGSNYVDLLSTWWSIPKLYQNNIHKDMKENNKRTSKQLNNLSNMLCIISEADYLIPSNRNDNIGYKIWFPKESASLNESENFEYYNRNEEVRNEIASELAMLGLKHTQNMWQKETNIDISSPGYTIDREREKIVSRHHRLTNYLNPGVMLDRRALALDYWSSCRTICRLEKNKTDVNIKRNNRFCHYLKSLNILCKNDYFEDLSKSLNSSSIDDIL